MATKLFLLQFLDCLENGHKFKGKTILEDSSLYLGNCSLVKELPDNLTIKHNFSLTKKSKLNKLPKKFRVNGYVDLRSSRITEIPGDMVVGKYSVLMLDNTKIMRVPKGVKPYYVYYDQREMTVDEYNAFRDNETRKRVYFLREKIVCLKNLLEIPELFDEVYYLRKNEFLSLMKRI